MAGITDILLKLTKHLYPLGRAFRIPVGSSLEKMHIALNNEECEAFEAATSGILDTILADNDNFTADDASVWERRLAIRSNISTSLDDRKAAIIRKYATPGDIPARQHWFYLQTQLRAAEFDVFVHENRIPTVGVWSNQTAASADSWIDIAYGEGLFAAISTDGTIMTSIDSVTWTTRTAPEANTWRGITFGNGRFVAVSNDGTNRVMFSDDGITWTAAISAAQNLWERITFGNGTFVAVSTDGDRRVMTSTDGQNWASRDSSDNTTAWSAITFGNRLFVAFGSGGTDFCMTSVDGIIWNAQTIPTTNTYTDVTFGHGRFVAVSSTGTERVLTSNDGITWTDRDSTDDSNNWTSVVYGHNLFVAISSTGTTRTMYSRDGITWTALAASQANSWNSVAFGANKFISISSGGTNRVMTLDSPTVYTQLDPGIIVSNLYGSFQYGLGQYGPGVSGAQIVNFVDKAKDILFVIPMDKRTTFFIGAEIFGDVATIAADREDEFRQLILDIKPAQTIGVLLISYT